MSKKFYLPIKEGSDGGLQLPEIGLWEQRPQDAFRKISKAIAEDDQSARVHSIPDLWARPLLFETALLDETHSMHLSVRGEWRGLLSAIALSEYARIDVQYEAVRFDEGLAFGKVALSLKPQSQIHVENTWSNIHIVKIAGRIVGITSPSTIVCTAEQYYIKDPSIRWQGLQGFEDPLAVVVNQISMDRDCVIDPLKRKAIRDWLVYLLSRINESSADKDGIQDGINRCLREFIGDLESVSLPGHDFDWVPKDKGIGSPVGFYGALYRYPNPPKNDVHPSDVEISAGLRSTDVRIILASAAISEQWRVEPHNIRFWHEHQLESAIDGTASSRNRYELQGSSLDGAFWLREEDVFLDNIHIFDREGVFSDTLRVAGNREHRSIIIPLKHEVGEWFDPQYLADNIVIEKSGGRYQVSVSLLLSGILGEDVKKVTISKTYDQEDVIEVFDEPVFDIWPPFQASGWNTYVSHYNSLAESELYVGVRKACVKSNNGKDVQQREETKGDVGRELTKLTQYPDVTLIWDQDSNPVGLLFPSVPPKKDNTRTNYWNVGVDFGTANTTVFLREDDGGEIRKLDLYLKPIGLFKPKVREQYNLYHFVPSGEDEAAIGISIPFPTLYKVFGSVKAEPETWLDGHIQFQTPELPVKIEGGIYHNLKWANDRESQIINKAFLDQLIDLIIAQAEYEGIKNIKWSYSVPSAFSRHKIERLARVWIQLLRSKDQLRDHEEPVMRTESYCSALYFKEEEGAMPKKGAICLDIGGKTTDIAVWQGNKLVFQTSLKCASQDILLRALVDEPEATRAILGSIPELAKQSMSQEDKIFAVQNSLQTQPADVLRGKIDTFSSDKEMRRIARHVAVGIGGVIYLVGTVVKKYVDEGMMDADVQGIYLGGNGAKMLDWLAGGDYDSSPLTSEYLRHMFFAGLQRDVQNIKIKRTTRGKEKTEVGYGLVSLGTLNASTEPICIAGEGLVVNNSQTIAATDSITPELISQGVELESLDCLKSFVRCQRNWAESNSEFMESLQLSVTEWGELTNTVNQQLSDLKSVDEKDIDYDGVFVHALRELLYKI